MTEILFVGEPAGVLGGVAKSLGREQPNWTIRQIADHDATLAQLGRRSADLVLASLGTEPLAYARLFDDISQRSPRTIRLALIDGECQLPDRIERAHQVLAARKDPSYLRPILAAGLEVAEQMRQHRQLEALIGNLHDVPSPPTLYFDIRQQLEGTHGDLDDMAQVTSRDPSLVARILKIANSGFYALPRSISSLSEAIGLIGTDTLLGLVLAAHLYSGLPPPGLRLETLWQHTLRVSTLARQITQVEGGDRQAQSQSAVAGLLHDIGLMVLLENEPARYQPLWQQSGGDEAALANMERSAFGVTHGELGALILMLWSLPREVVDAVASSHRPNTGIDELSLTSRAVLAAEWLLDGHVAEDTEALPTSLEDLPDGTLTRWREMRDDLASQIAEL